MKGTRKPAATGSSEVTLLKNDKQEVEFMNLVYTTKQNNGEEYLEVTGAKAPATFVIVPKKVASIAPHAFEGRNDIREIVLPDSVTKIGSFAFYRCGCLRKITLTDSCTDYGDGAIRGCSGLTDIEVFCGVRHQDDTDEMANSENSNSDRKTDVHTSDFTIIRSMLRDSDAQLTFLIHLPGADACLAFPSFTDVATENTYARQIQFDISGSGYGYREVVGSKEIGWREYDRLFGRAPIDSVETAALVALSRLMYPYMLEDQARVRYESYLGDPDNSPRILSWLVGAEGAVSAVGAVGNVGAMEDGTRLSRIKFMGEHELININAFPAAIKLASSAGKTEIAALLMEYSKRREGSFDEFVL